MCPASKAAAELVHDAAIASLASNRVIDRRMAIPDDAPERPRIGTRPKKKERSYVDNDDMRDFRFVDNLKLSA
jgi:hypothetical protein